MSMKAVVRAGPVAACLFALTGLAAFGQCFEDWKKRDQEAFRAFQEEQRGASAATSAKTNAASRVGPSRVQPKPAVPARADGPPASATKPLHARDVAPVVLPEGSVTALRDDAGWVSSVTKDPGKFLDALEGGRPGGDVSAMIALLRQTQGPFDTNMRRRLTRSSTRSRTP